MLYSSPQEMLGLALRSSNACTSRTPITWKEELFLHHTMSSRDVYDTSFLGDTTLPPFCSANPMVEVLFDSPDVTGNE